MADNKENSNFWTTVPGILTGVSSVIAAIGAIYIATHKPPDKTVGTPDITPSAQNNWSNGLWCVIAFRVADCRYRC
ncbi:hypothetical protein LC593_02575 [Nostoc sp. CHAB 5844]|nr:hypothetical protein [Nostoc sp. CHAB 5844]